MNAYYTNSGIGRRHESSDSIRRAYLANSRKRAVAEFIRSLSTAVDSRALLRLIMALRIIGGVVCAVGFFAVIGLIETNSISVAAGILCTALIALLECLCFIPVGSSRAGEERR